MQIDLREVKIVAHSRSVFSVKAQFYGVLNEIGKSQGPRLRIPSIHGVLNLSSEELK